MQSKYIKIIFFKFEIDASYLTIIINFLENSKFIYNYFKNVIIYLLKR